ncbi:MAG: hypothetical protein N3B17_06915 [Chlorobi bacterium]|nr:hypothetical protein [Chlorobiota bacterium]
MTLHRVRSVHAMLLGGVEMQSVPLYFRAALLLQQSDAPLVRLSTMSIYVHTIGRRDYRASRSYSTATAPVVG